ncbi:MAG: 50S ribosomal protein L32 [Patescibacteria group bacterium]|nr:50S ribosomal protein L32 [Patescibacteria group bacterium]MDE2218273.1 50S ribosomal protein L32 [Patescibacteria group bacterium]
MRHNRSHRGNVRSHHGLSDVRFSACPDCGKKHLPHTVCENCGKYRTRPVLDVHSKITKREKKAKDKAKAEAR